MNKFLQDVSSSRMAVVLTSITYRNVVPGYSLIQTKVLQNFILFLVSRLEKLRRQLGVIRSSSDRNHGYQDYN